MLEWALELLIECVIEWALVLLLECVIERLYVVMWMIWHRFPHSKNWMRGPDRGSPLKAQGPDCGRLAKWMSVGPQKQWGSDYASWETQETASPPKAETGSLDGSWHKAAVPWNNRKVSVWMWHDRRNTSLNDWCETCIVRWFKQCALTWVLYMLSACVIWQWRSPIANEGELQNLLRTSQCEPSPQRIL